MANSGKLWKRDCEGEVQGLAMARDRTDIFEEVAWEARANIN